MYIAYIPKLLSTYIHVFTLRCVYRYIRFNVHAMLLDPLFPTLRVAAHACSPP